MGLVNLKIRMWVQRWWHTPLIPALRRQRQMELCEFKASLVYRARSRTLRAFTQRNPVKGEGNVGRQC